MAACVNCGSEVAAGARVCGVCSYPVAQEPSTPPPPPIYGTPEQHAGWPAPQGQEAAYQAEGGAGDGGPPPPAHYLGPQGPYAGPPQPWTGAAVPARTDGGAIAALICGILGLTFCPVVLSIVAIIIGAQSERRIKESGGVLEGAQMAKAGWILGVAGLVVMGGVILMAIAIPLFLSAGFR